MVLNERNDPILAAIDRCSTPTSVWEEVTSRLPHLLLSPNMVIEKSAQPVVLDGGNCDIYKGKLRKNDGTVVEVAIKRTRQSLFKGVTFGKVDICYRSWSFLNANCS